MVALYIGGQKVEWADAEKLFAEVAAKQTVEFCDENGRVTATSVPGSEPVDWHNPLPETDPPDLGSLGPFLTLDEWRRLNGWD